MKLDDEYPVEDVWRKNDVPWEVGAKLGEDSEGEDDDPLEAGAKLEEEPKKDVEELLKASSIDGWQEETKGTQAQQRRTYFILTEDSA